MKPYKRMSKGALTLLVAGTLVAGGTMSTDTQTFAQESPSSSYGYPTTPV